MLFKLSNLNSNLALTLGYLNPALNNSALEPDNKPSGYTPVGPSPPPTPAFIFYVLK